MSKNFRNQGLRTITVQRKNKSARGRVRHLKFWVPAFAGTSGVGHTPKQKPGLAPGLLLFVRWIAGSNPAMTMRRYCGASRFLPGNDM